MAMAATKSLFPTVARAMARHKTHVVRTDVVASLAVTNSAAIIAAVKTVVAMKVVVVTTVAVRPASATNAEGHRLPAANPEVTANARAIMGRSHRASVGIRMR